MKGQNGVHSEKKDAKPRQASAESAGGQAPGGCQSHGGGQGMEGRTADACRRGRGTEDRAAGAVRKGTGAEDHVAGAARCRQGQRTQDHAAGAVWTRTGDPGPRITCDADKERREQAAGVPGGRG